MSNNTNELGARPDGPGSHPTGHAAAGVDGAPRFDPSREIEPYENRLTIEQLRREVRMLWDREAAFRDDIAELPEAPSHETLWFLVDAGSALKWPHAWNIGNELQRAHPWGVVPAKTELECAAGLWVMIREGILARIPRDSDGSPKGGDACGSVHDSAGRSHRQEDISNVQ